MIQWTILPCRRRAPRKLQEAANLSEGDSDYDPAVSSDGNGGGGGGGGGNGGRRRPRGAPAARKQTPPPLSQPPMHWQPHLAGGPASLRMQPSPDGPPLRPALCGPYSADMCMLRSASASWSNQTIATQTTAATACHTACHAHICMCRCPSSLSDARASSTCVLSFPLP